jgi:hypothetical protein
MDPGRGYYGSGGLTLLRLIAILLLVFGRAAVGWRGRGPHTEHWTGVRRFTNTNSFTSIISKCERFSFDMASLVELIKHRVARRRQIHHRPAYERVCGSAP